MPKTNAKSISNLILDTFDLKLQGLIGGKSFCVEDRACKGEI